MPFSAIPWPQGRVCGLHSGPFRAGQAAVFHLCDCPLAGPEHEFWSSALCFVAVPSTRKASSLLPPDPTPPAPQDCPSCRVGLLPPLLSTGGLHASCCVTWDEGEVLTLAFLGCWDTCVHNVGRAVAPLKEGGGEAVSQSSGLAGEPRGRRMGKMTS